MSEPISAEQVIELRRRLGLNQTAFAMRLGVSQAAVNRWEHGLRSPTGLAKKAVLALMAEQDKPE